MAEKKKYNKKEIAIGVGLSLVVIYFTGVVGFFGVAAAWGLGIPFLKLYTKYLYKYNKLSKTTRESIIKSMGDQKNADGERLKFYNDSKDGKGGTPWILEEELKKSEAKSLKAN